MYYSVHDPLLERDPAPAVAAPEVPQRPFANSATGTPPTPEEVEEADARLAELDRQFQADQARREEARAYAEGLLKELSDSEIDLSRKIVEPTPVIALGRTLIASEGNLSAVVGESKSKKSFLCTAIVGDLLSLRDKPTLGFRPNKAKVLWIDTEQSELHVRKIARRISHLTGWSMPDRVHPFLKIYAWREYPPEERFSRLLKAIEGWNPKLVVIDGIADLMHNTNDLEESERLVTDLMRISTVCRIHILSVLHTNPNSDKARGHLGSALQRKCETVLYVHRVGERSVVEPQFCRNEPFERFAFQVENTTSDLGLPTPAELPMPPTSGSCTVASLLREHYSGTADRLVVTNKLVEQGITLTNARVMVHRAIKRGEVFLDEEGSMLYVAEAAPN